MKWWTKHEGKWCGNCYGIKNVFYHPMDWCYDCTRKAVKDMTEFEEYLLKEIKRADKTIQKMMYWNAVYRGCILKILGEDIYNTLEDEFERIMLEEEE